MCKLQGRFKHLPEQGARIDPNSRALIVKAPKKGTLSCRVFHVSGRWWTLAGEGFTATADDIDPA